MTHDATPTADHAARDHVLTLLISAPDRPGLVAGVAGTLFEHDANILEADQHDDAGTGCSSSASGSRSAPRASPALRAAMQSSVDASGSTGRMRDRARAAPDGHLRVPRGPLPVRPARPPPLGRAALRHPAASSATTTIWRPSPPSSGCRSTWCPCPATPSPRRRTRQQQLLDDAGIDLIVLARYMRILSPDVRGALAGPRHQHPPLVPARVRRRAAVSPGARARRQAHRRHRPLRHDRAR